MKKIIPLFLAFFCVAAFATFGSTDDTIAVIEEIPVTGTYTAAADYDSLETLIKESPERLELRFMLASKAAKSGDNAKIGGVVKDILQHAGETDFDWTLEGVKLSPDSSRTETKQSAYSYMIHLYQGGYRDVLPLCDEYLNLFAGDAQGLTLKGIILGNKGNLDGALECFKEAEKQDPFNPELLLNLANLYAAVGDKTEAMKYCNIIIADSSIPADLRDVAAEIQKGLDDSGELQEVSPYYLVHQWLSVIAPVVTAENIELLESPGLLNTRLAAQNGIKSPFSDADIEVTEIDADGKRVFVWKFPEPKGEREALYTAFIPVDGVYTAYSICRGRDVDWELSTSDESKRNTFGRIKRPESAAECVELLKERGAFSGDIKPGEFIQEGYKPQF